MRDSHSYVGIDVPADNPHPLVKTGVMVDGPALGRAICVRSAFAADGEGDIKKEAP